MPEPEFEVVKVRARVRLSWRRRLREWWRRRRLTDAQRALEDQLDAAIERKLLTGD